MRRSLRGICLVVVLCLGALSCASRQPIRGQEAGDLDRKLSTYAFIEEGDLVTFIVGTRATRYRGKEDPYIPVEICISNNGLRRLILTRESFTLIDEEGNRYPAANPRELIEGYDFLDVDRDGLSELREIVFNKFSAYTRYQSKFSPTNTATALRETLVRDMVSLPRYGYIIDFIYFPTPQTGVKGHRFELFLESPDLPDPVFLKFIVE
jgi:hypothetical protein